MNPDDLQAALLTLKLAGLSTVLLLALCLPLAWWLSQTHRRWPRLLEALSLLPLILPPTVLGYYLLLAFHPQGPFSGLAFSFEGLVVGSMVYSLPFALLPLRQAFSSLDPVWLETAACLGASPWERFIHVGLPLALPGLLAALCLSFAHTLGEFGVVLMLGGSIPGETRVLSIALYEHVEAMNLGQAHKLAALMAIAAWLLSLPLMRLRKA